MERDKGKLTEQNRMAVPGSSTEMQDKLNVLEREHPASFAAAKATVDALHEQAIKGVSSAVARVAAGGQAAASELARSEHRESRRTHKAGEPSGHKRGLKNGAVKARGNRPETPKQVQE